ncbi:MAG: HK97 gp10 family phage protein [Christensenellaceae bacterium]|jgi:hypothetical protein
MKVELTWRGEELLAALEQGVETALTDIGRDLMQRSAAQAPTDSGELKASCYMQTDGTSVTVGYAAPHAAAQHEDLTLAHKSGKAKFLEDPFNENAERYVRMIADAVKGGL